MVEDDAPAGHRTARSDLTVVDVDGCVSVYSPRRQQVLSLNETASEIWRLSTEQPDVANIVAVLAAAYRTQPEAIQADVERTIALFEAEDLYDTEHLA